MEMVLLFYRKATYFCMPLGGIGEAKKVDEQAWGQIMEVTDA